MAWFGTVSHWSEMRSGVHTLSRELFQLTDGGRLAVDVVQDQVLLGPVLEGLDDSDRERRVCPRDGLVHQRVVFARHGWRLCECER